MLTFEYQLIFGASWVAEAGSVNADSYNAARVKVFEALEIDDPNPEKWIRATNSVSRFIVYLTEATDDLGAERVEFWQVPTLFSQTK